MTLIILLAVLALAFGLLEAFIIPGFGWAGLSSIACAIADAVLVYHAFGLGWACAVIVIALVVLALLLYLMAHSRTFERMSLHASINSTNATTEQLSIRVGDTGKALTRLALVGNARINGKMVEVKSSGAFINPGTPVRVIQVCDAQVTVEVDESIPQTDAK